MKKYIIKLLLPLIFILGLGINQSSAYLYGEYETSKGFKWVFDENLTQVYVNNILKKEWNKGTNQLKFNTLQWFNNTIISFTDGSGESCMFPDDSYNNNYMLSKDLYGTTTKIYNSSYNESIYSSSLNSGRYLKDSGGAGSSYGTLYSEWEDNQLMFDFTLVTLQEPITSPITSNGTFTPYINGIGLSEIEFNESGLLSIFIQDTDTLALQKYEYVIGPDDLNTPLIYNFLGLDYVEENTNYDIYYEYEVSGEIYYPDPFNFTTGDFINTIPEVGTGCYIEVGEVGNFVYNSLTSDNTYTFTGGLTGVDDLMFNGVFNSNNNDFAFNIYGVDSYVGNFNTLTSLSNIEVIPSGATFGSSFSTIAFSSYDNFNYFQLNIKDNNLFDAKFKIYDDVTTKNYFKDEQGNDIIYYGNELIKFNKYYSTLYLELFPSDYYIINGFDFGYYLYEYDTEVICNNLNESSVLINDSYFDMNAELNKYKSDFTDCGYLNMLRPSCILAGTKNILIDKIKNINFSKVLYSLGNLVDFSIPENYKLPYSLPEFDGTAFGNFKTHYVTLDSTPPEGIGYINNDIRNAIIVNGQELYSIDKGLWAKFLNNFVPVLISIFYFVLVVLFIGILIFPFTLFYKYLFVFLGYITFDDVKGTGKSSLILLPFFLTFYSLLFGSFVYITGLYFYNLSELSYNFRGFIGNFFDFLLNFFGFTGVSIINVTNNINDMFYSIIFSLLIYYFARKFARIT